MIHTARTFPNSAGTYVLILRLDADHRLTIGRLGMFSLSAGWYTYVGSAFGGGGLAGRLKHHLAPAPRPHWHIDYLRAAAPVLAVWWIASDHPYEHEWAAALQHAPGAAIPIPRFGASDCRCPAHLFHFPASPEPALLNLPGAITILSATGQA